MKQNDFNDFNDKTIDRFALVENPLTGSTSLEHDEIRANGEGNAVCRGGSGFTGYAKQRTWSRDPLLGLCLI